MACEILTIGHRTLSVTIRDALRMQDMRAIQDASRALIEQAGHIRVMVILRDYRGFERDADWSDLSFAAQYGDRIEKMAIVGDSRWEAEALAFTGKGARPTQIEYFRPSEFAAAQAWIS